MTAAPAPTSLRNAAAAPDPPLSSDTGISPRRHLPLAALIFAQLVLIAAATVWMSTGWPWWACALLALTVIVLFTFRWRGTGLLQSVAARWSFRRARGRRAELIAAPAPFDSVIGDADPCGFRWDGDTLSTLLQIEDAPEDLTVLEPGSTVSGDMVALDVLAACLRQFDIELDSIDVLSHGCRSHGHTPLAAVYDGVLGPLPAIAHRTVWVVVRFDPARCPEAVALRGGGRSGLLHTAMVATRRVANQLGEAGLRVRTLSAAEVGQAVSQLCGGANLPNLHEDWQYCADGNYRMVSFALTADILTTAGLSRLWAVPSDATVLSISLRNGPRGTIAIAGTVRFDTFGSPATGAIEGLRPLAGKQFEAVLAGLPLGRSSGEFLSWSVSSDAAGFGQIRLPASGCGQVIGADDDGRAVALPIFGPHIARVEIAGSLHLAQQVVLRALALGARVLVHSNRSGSWRSMVEAVGDPQLLWVAEFNRSTLQAGSDRNYTVALFDGVHEAATRVGVTVIALLPSETSSRVAASEPADVVLRQLPETPDRVAVATRRRTAVVSMVATDEELRYIGDSLRTG